MSWRSRVSAKLWIEPEHAAPGAALNEGKRVAGRHETSSDNGCCSWGEGIEASPAAVAEHGDRVGAAGKQVAPVGGPFQRLRYLLSPGCPAQPPGICVSHDNSPCLIDIGDI